MEQILSLSLWSITTVPVLFGNHSESRSLTEICFTRCQCCSQSARRKPLLLGAKQQPAPTCFAKLLPGSAVVKKLLSLLSLTQKWLSFSLQLPLVLLKDPRLFAFCKTQVFYKINTVASVIVAVSPHGCCRSQGKFITGVLPSNCYGVTLRNVYKRRSNKYWEGYTLQKLFFKDE